MKTLYLVRHAKSDWSHAQQTDFERGLSNRGVKDLDLISNLISSLIQVPDCLLSSPANRAFTTAKVFAEKFGLSDSDVLIEDGLYANSTKFIIKTLADTNDKFQSLMIFGHNPDITSLASYFSGTYFENVPTTGVVALEFDCSSWKNIEDKNAKVLFFEYPKKHK